MGNSGRFSVVRYPNYYVVTDSNAPPNPLGGDGIVFESRSRLAAIRKAESLRKKSAAERAAKAMQEMQDMQSVGNN